MQEKSKKVSKTIRIQEGVYHQARVASVASRMPLGQWLKEAILEKLNGEPQPTKEKTS